MQKILALLVLLSIAFSAASARLVPLLNDNSATRISGEYIVVLRPGMSADDVNQHIQDLQGDFALSSGVNHLIYTPFNIGSFKGFSAKLSLDMLGRERAHPDVSYIEANQEVRALDNDKCATQQSVLWNLDRISEVKLDLDGEYHYEGTGQGVNAYIVDTGIQVDNVDFEGRASWGFKVDNQEVDGNGHGTHVASTVGGKAYGVAKKVTLIAVKVLGTNGSGTTAGVISGINYVTDQHSKGTRPSVANMSLGGGRSASLVSAVENSVAAGVIYAVAAGNDNANACNYSPADAPNAITVGATTSQDYRSTFSNWGACVDIFAPGTTITAAWIGAKNAIKTISGTSMASPHVAGAVAILLGKDPNLTPEQVVNLLTDSCTTNALKDVKGSPNCLLFSGCDN